jgi:hypothetical protein
MVMHPLHVVKKVVSAREAIARDTTLASGVVAQVWPVTVSVHAVRFSFVAKEAGSGGEFLLGACVDLAAEGFEMRVNKLAVVGVIGSAHAVWEEDT